MAAQCRGEDAIHRAGQPVGERLQREFQREASGRVAKWRDFLLVEGGADTDRAVEAGVQHDTASQLTWMLVAGT